MSVALCAEQTPALAVRSDMATFDGLHFPGPSYPIGRSRHLAEHLTWMRMRRLSDRVLYSRRRTVVLLAEHLGADPADAGYPELYGWQLHLADTSLDLVRWQTHMARPYFRWLHRMGYRPDDPAALLPVPRAKRGLPRPMAEHKVMAVVEQAPPRLLPWLLLAGWCGLRAGEIAHLRVDDFTVEPDGRVFVRVRGKGDRIRDVAVPGWAWTVIAARLPESGRAWRRERRRDDRLGVVTPQHVSQLCNRYLHKIGIPDTLHSLRHRCATLALRQSGGDLALVQDFLGHADPKTTRIYAYVNPERMSAVVEAFPAPANLARVGRRLHVVDEAGGSA